MTNAEENYNLIVSEIFVDKLNIQGYYRVYNYKDVRNVRQFLSNHMERLIYTINRSTN